MVWEKLLDNIRSGKIPISDIGEKGVPSYANGMPYYELMQLLAAVVAGYMVNYNKIRSLRHLVRREEDVSDG